MRKWPAPCTSDQSLMGQPRIEYNKKPGKAANVKCIKDNAVPRDDMYKSGTIHTGPGEPPSSVSRPTPRGRQGAGKPITSGKLLRPGGPNGQPSKFASRPQVARPVPQPAQPRPTPQAAAAQVRPIPQPVAAVNGTGHSRNDSSSSYARVPPPPPPSQAPPAAKKDIYRALYDFTGATTGELAMAKDDLLEIKKKEGNGM